MKKILAIFLSAGLLTGAGFAVENQDKNIEAFMDTSSDISYEQMHKRCHGNDDSWQRLENSDDLYQACLKYMEENDIDLDHCSKEDMRNIKNHCKNYLREDSESFDEEDFERFCHDLENYKKEERIARKNRTHRRNSCHSRQAEKVLR